MIGFMAQRRTKVRPEMKLLLVDQAGGKCANPGCANRLVQLHHIKQWHVYQTHDEAHMIAVCAGCHDHIHRGELRISDEDLYKWKRIDRTKAATTGQIFIEPGPAPVVVLGNARLEGSDGVVAFDFSRHRLAFAVREGNLMLLNVKLSSSDGEPLLDVVDHYVRQQADGIKLDLRPGAVEVRGGLSSPFIPDWLRTLLLGLDPLYGVQRMPLLSLKVLEPGLVRAEGFWLDEDKGIVATRDRIVLVGRPRRSVSIMGGPTFRMCGPATAKVFGLV